MPHDLSPRHLVVRAIEVAAVVIVVVLAVSALPGLDDVRARLESADPLSVVALAVAEIGSCLGYVVVFRSTFCRQMSWGLSYDIALAELAANSLLPAGGGGGLALGVWALRQAGMAVSHIARRTVAFFVVTSAANFVALVLVGLGVFAGILAGRDSALLALGPALVAGLAMLVVGASPRLLHALGKRGAGLDGDGWRARAWRASNSWLRAVADGVDQAIALLRSHSFGVIVGSFAYLAFDIAALGFGFAAVASVPPFGTLVLGYLIGQLGNLVPLPGGIGGTEGALIGVFALYGVHLADAAAAVLIYRTFALTMPALLGVPAFVVLRRRLARADQPARDCAPLAVDLARLPESAG
jgi:uncharacterized membrane protein YbhN (UPF0104 family)